MINTHTIFEKGSYNSPIGYIEFYRILIFVIYYYTGDICYNNILHQYNLIRKLQLSYRDQAILLEESWCELFILTAAQWNFPVEESLLIPAHLSLDKKQILSDEARRLRELLARCAILRIDHSEYACLKAIVLFKGGESQLIDSIA